MKTKSVAYNVAVVEDGPDAGRFIAWCERTGILQGYYDKKEEAIKRVECKGHFVCRMANS